MVCLGNICRSPVAEGIMRKKASDKGLNLFIDSAGTSNYHIGEHPDRRSAENAKKNRVDISKLKARQFTTNDFSDFDLIYVMDSSNYNDVVALAKTAEDRNKVQLILNSLYPDSNMSVPDPYYGGEQGFENVFTLLNNACEIIASTIASENEKG
jgi:protein-tyrosine phosphatase